MMASEIEERIITYIRSNAKGVSTTDIQKEIPGIDVRKVVTIVNKSIAQHLISVYTLNGKVIYKPRAITAEAEAVRHADNEEKVVYQIIEESGTKGIWIRDIRIKSNLIQTQLNKIIKNLESKKLIKSVKTVTAGKKKFYMLYNLEPDVLLTGGAWYSDQGFDSDFVDALNQACKRFLESKRENAKKLVGGPLVVNNNSYASATEVCKFINELGLSKIQLSDDEINQILTTLLFDGKIEKKLAVDGNHLYKAVETWLPPLGFVRTPCGICPVFRNCDETCSVNPKNCSYLTEWLS